MVSSGPRAGTATLAAALRSVSGYGGHVHRTLESVQRGGDRRCAISTQDQKDANDILEFQGQATFIVSRRSIDKVRQRLEANHVNWLQILEISMCHVGGSRAVGILDFIGYMLPNETDGERSAMRRSIVRHIPKLLGDISVEGLLVWIDEGDC